MGNNKEFKIDFNKCKKRNFPTFAKPAISGYFSLDENRTYLQDASRLKYLHLPKNFQKVHLDLNDNFGTATERPESAYGEKIDHLLKFILQNKQKPTDEELSNHKKENLKNVDFICFRGLLINIMITPYNDREDWIILATRWKDNIYLCAVETEEKKKSRLNETMKQKRFHSWGYKFEQYLLSESPSVVPKTIDSVIETEEFCCVFETKINNHRLLFGAEMDGIKSDVLLPEQPDLANIEFVELKTNRHIEHRRQDYNFRKFKLIKWWAQSFVVGIKEIYCGYRNDEGVVEEIKPYSVSVLSKMASNFWDPCVCMNFADEFLTFVKSAVTTNDETAVWKFEFSPGRNRNTITCERNDNIEILPKWFTDEFKTSLI